MKRLQVYQYELMPTGEQQRLMRRFAGSCRFVFNKALAWQQTLKNLERAYKNFFEKRADFPRFKKKGQSDSFRYPQGIKLDQGNSRAVLGTVKNVTVSQSCGKWLVSFQTEREVKDPVPKATSAVGIAAL